MYRPNSFWTWTFFVVTVVQAVIVIGLESFVFAEFESSLRAPARGINGPPSALTIPTYLAIFIFGFVYQVALVWDALRLQNTIQVIGICLYNLGLLIYSAVETQQVDDAINDLGVDIAHNTWVFLRPCLIAAPCVIALGTALLSLCAWKLYNEFAWTIYKHISADLRLKRRYLTYQIYIALLKFDFFFFLGFTVQFLVVVRGNSTAERALTIAAIPITILLLFLAAYFTRLEWFLGQIAVIVLYFAAMAYFIFKLVRMYASVRAAQYRPARHSLTVFAVLTILLLSITIATAFACMRNFNKGLKPHIRQRRPIGAAAADPAGEDELAKYSSHAAFHPDDYHGHPHQLDSVPTRMTID